MTIMYNPIPFFCGVVALWCAVVTHVDAIPVLVPLIGVIGILLVKLSFFILAAFFFVLTLMRKYARLSVILGTILLGAGVVTLFIFEYGI